MAALTLLATACGGADDSAPAPGPVADCHLVLSYGERTYQGMNVHDGDVTLGRRLGDGRLLPCADTIGPEATPVNVYRIAGEPADEIIAADVRPGGSLMVFVSADSSGYVDVVEELERRFPGLMP